jgi:hypothetical protein
MAVASTEYSPARFAKSKRPSNVTLASAPLSSAVVAPRNLALRDFASASPDRAMRSRSCSSSPAYAVFVDAAARIAAATLIVATARRSRLRTGGDREGNEMRGAY